MSLRPGVCRLTVAVAVVVCASAVMTRCGRQETPPPASQTSSATPASVALKSVPLPDLSRLEPVVRDEIQRAHTSLDAGPRDPQALVERYGATGMLFHAHDLFASAEVCYLNAQALAADDFRWPAYLGYVYTLMGDIAAAIASLERAVALRPGDLSVLVRLGELQLGTGRAAEARARFQQALAVDSRCAAALAGLGRIDMQDKQFARAIERLERALALAPWASSLHYPLAMAYRAQGNTARAEAHLRERGEIRVGVHDPLMEALQQTAGTGKLVLRERGIAAARTAQWANAVDELRKALALDQSDVTTRMYLAGALWMNDERAAAAEQYRQAAALDPTNARAHMYLGRIAALQGRDRQAVERLEEATRLDGQSVAAWLSLGMARQRLRRFSQALQAYEEVLRLDPGNAQVRLGVAFSLIALERYAEARARLEQDLDVLPDQPVFLHTLARLLAAAPDPKVRHGARALGLAEQVARQLRSADVVETAAMAAAELGRFDDAMQWQQVAIRAAREAGRADVVERLTAMLSQYQLGQPCREPWRRDDPAFSPAPLLIQFGEADASLADR